jgi:hypothetical protein
MAPVATAVAERRREPRVAGGGYRFNPAAVLRPGLEVVLINISRRGALVESSARLRPGARAGLLLSGTDARASVEGRIGRCHVAGLDPLRYRGVIVFDKDLDIGTSAGGSE